MEPRSVIENLREGVPVSELTGERDRVRGPAQRLVRVAEHPERPGAAGAEVRARIEAMADRVSAMLTRIVEGDALLRVVERPCEIAHPKQRDF